MSAKPKTPVGRLEAEIDRLREESNWKKAQELAEQLGQRTGGLSDPLTTFYIGESRLEQHLEEFPPNESNINKAKVGLTEAKRLLQACVNEGPKCGLYVDGHFLLAKLLYAQGCYEDTLNHLTLAKLDNLSEKQLKIRLLKIVAESFAIKGFCLEKIPPGSTSKYKVKEREQQILQCLVKAGDLALRYLQELEKHLGQSGGTVPMLASGAVGAPSIISPPMSALSYQPSNTEFRIGAILEMALQKAPLLHIQSGQMAKAINQYRNVLSAVETSSTQSLRQTMSRQLAEVLLRGVSEGAYKKFLPEPENSKTSGSPWKPKKYTGQSLFVPKDENEEVLLLLFISEAMAVRNAVLDRSPEFKDARIHSYLNVAAVYDLLTISLVRRGQSGVLCESFERAMKFAFEEYHIWSQFAMALMANGRYARAHLLLQECARLQTQNALPLLLSARVCFEHLGQYEIGVKEAEQALEREKQHSQGLLAKCYLLVGVGYELLSEQARPQPKKSELRTKAFDAFIKAQAADTSDHLAEFYLALHYAEARQINEALNHARAALNLRPEHLHTLHLMILLLSAQKQYTEALQLLDVALEEYPENLNLLYTKTHLEELTEGAEVALLTSKQMLQKWRILYEGQLKNDFQDENLHRVASDTRSLFQMYSSELSDRDSGSPAANSVAAVSRVEHALSEVASSVNGFQPKPGPQSVWMLQLQIWLLIGDLYLNLGQPVDAEACIQEASTIFPLSHQLMVLKGLVHECRHEYFEAKKCFQNAVSINPLHVRALQHLGLMYHYLGSSHLAEKTLRDAVTIDPLSHQSWYNMGVVLQEMGNFDSASDCIATAIDLESTSPILPFSYITRTLE